MIFAKITDIPASNEQIAPSFLIKGLKFFNNILLEQHAARPIGLWYATGYFGDRMYNEATPPFLVRFPVLIFLLLFWVPCFPLTGQTVPKRYLFFLHGKILEDQPVNPVSPEFGAYQYEPIVQAFKREKLTVLSERRQKDTDVREYARRVVRQIDSLLQRGVRAEHITVAGTSKGAIIAMFVSTYLKNPRTNFVFVADCNEDILERMPDIHFCGQVLSIYEKSDPIGQTCIRFKERSSLSVPRYKEIEIHTGRKHGFIYSPMPEWIKPTVNWARGNYTLP